MIGLNDRQLDSVMILARELEPEKRSAYLQRTSPICKLGWVDTRMTTSPQLREWRSIG
jgi:hypothetical protein